MKDTRQQNSTSHPILLRMVSSTDHVTAVTGATVTVTAAKDGAVSYSATSGAVTELGDGLYWWAGNATDRNTLGSMAIKATATGADDYLTSVTIVPSDPFSGSVTVGAFAIGAITSAAFANGAITATVAPNLDAAVSSRSTYAGGDTSGTTTLLTRLTAARSGYLDNLNVGGNVASHADIVAINTSSSKHLLLVTVGQYEPGETYTIEMRTFAAADGSAVNADTTPTLTATGNVSGSLAANLSAATNPATGVYRWTYTPGAAPTLEQIRFDGSAVISASTFTLSCYAQTVDQATVVWTTTDQSHLTAIFNNQTTILGQVNKIGTNSGDSAELVTALGTISTNLNATISSRLATTGYTAPDNADIAAAKAVTDKLNSGLQLVSGTTYQFTAGALSLAPTGGGGGGGITGNNQVTLTFHDAAGNPVQGLQVTVGGLVAPVTDANGQTSFGAPNGTYTVVASPNGLTTWAAQTLIVNGTTAPSPYIGTAFVISPANQGQTNAYLYTYDGAGNLNTNTQTFTFKLIQTSDESNVFSNSVISATTSSGLLQVTLKQNATYTMTTPGGKTLSFTTSRNSTFNIGPALIGT